VKPPHYVRAVADKYRLKTRTDECGEIIIPGKRAATTRRRNLRKAEMLAVGFAIFQDCDGEGTAKFDATNENQVSLAIRVAGIRRRRVPSEAQLFSLAERASSGTLRTGCFLGLKRVGKRVVIVCALQNEINLLKGHLSRSSLFFSG
jgi:hypothetical protein